MINTELQPDAFKINGVSCKTVGVWADTPSIPPMAKQRYTTYINSADEDSTIADDSYEDISYRLTFFTFDNQDYDNSAIYEFFSDAKRLEISRFPNKYFKIRQLDIGQPEQNFNGKKVKYTANFRLAPFKYSTSNEEITLSNGDIVENKGTRYSRPTIEIAGSGTITLSINGVEFTVVLADTGQYVVIDSERLITYDKTTKQLIQNGTSGYYPMLPVGESQITWSGGTTVYVKIKVNERLL
jgi:phage-related protein